MKKKENKRIEKERKKKYLICIKYDYMKVFVLFSLNLIISLELKN